MRNEMSIKMLNENTSQPLPDLTKGFHALSKMPQSFKEKIL